MNLDPNFLAAPVAIPLVTAAIILAVSRLGGRRNGTLQQMLTFIALSLNLLVSLLILADTLSGRRIVLQMGNWDAPYGITAVADSLSGIMLVSAGIVALCIVPFAMSTLDFHRERMGFYPLLLFLMMGVNGAFRQVTSSTCMSLSKSYSCPVSSSSRWAGRPTRSTAASVMWF